jgi:hypothetical protein
VLDKHDHTVKGEMTMFGTALKGLVLFFIWTVVTLTSNTVVQDGVTAGVIGFAAVAAVMGLYFHAANAMPGVHDKFRWKVWEFANGLALWSGKWSPDDDTDEVADQVTPWSVVNFLYDHSLRYQRKDGDHYIYHYRNVEMVAVSPDGWRVQGYNRDGQLVWPNTATTNMVKLSKRIETRSRDIDLAIESQPKPQPAPQQPKQPQAPQQPQRAQGQPSYRVPPLQQQGKAKMY